MAFRSRPSLRARLGTFWPVVVVVAFAAVYLASLTFVYVDGDDASSIIFHLLGRNAATQPPYSPYHSLMDSYLGLLPAQEPILMHAAIATTSLAAMLMAILILRRSFDWAPSLQTSKPLVALAILLTAPELFYLGLVYSPSVAAMCFMLAAHIVVRDGASADRGERAWRFAVSALLVGLGGAARWDTIAYGAVIATDLLMDVRVTPLRARLRFVVGWGAAALLAWVGTIYLTGYGPAAMLDHVLASGPVETPTLLTAVRMQSLCTPAFVLLGLLGLAHLIRERSRLLPVIAVGLIPVMKFAAFGVPKWIISSIPVLCFCVAVGFDRLWRYGRGTRLNYAVVAAMVVLLVIPWIVGVQARLGDSAWGPGFEVRPIDRPQAEGLRWDLVLGPGAAVPTPEGPRPLLGHGPVLLGGNWRRLAESRDRERRHVIDVAIERGIPVLAESGPGFLVAELGRRGFTTQDPKYAWVHDGAVVKRVFSAPERGSLALLSDLHTAGRWDDDGICLLRSVAGADTLVTSGYTSTLRRIYKARPEAVSPLGAESAILNLVGPGRSPDAAADLAAARGVHLLERMDCWVDERQAGGVYATCLR